MHKHLITLSTLTLLILSGCVSDIINFTEEEIVNPDDGSNSKTEVVSGTEDDIDATEFTGTVTVVYSSSGATVSGADSELFKVTASGNQVTITYTGEEYIVYKLSGTAPDGFFKLYSEKKQAIWLENLNLTNPSGAAINNQSGKRTFVYVEGTNTLADATSAAYTTTGTEDMKGVFFSEGQLVFSGSGTLSVTANNNQGKSAIVSDDYVHFQNDAAVTATCGSGAGHGVKANDYVQISGGILNITTKAAMKKGIASDGFVLVEGGTTSLDISGGVAKDSDSGEYKGSAGIKADNYFGMTGGELTIKNTGNGGKGISAGDYDYDSKNHTLADSYISGGTLSITTTGSESNDVSSKGIKIGYKESASTKAGPGGLGGNSGSYVYAGNLKISGGNIYVSCAKSEGLEAKGTLTFDGGATYVYSAADDAINCQGQMTINDGYVCGYSTGNDALDANGDMKIYGGYVMAICSKGTPEVALDANTEGGYKLYIYKGATVVAYGGLEGGYSSEQTVYTMSATTGWNALWDGSDYIAAFKCPANVASFAVTAPSLATTCYKGVSISGATTASDSGSGNSNGNASASNGILCNGCWATSGISGGTSVTLTTYSGNSGGPGGNPGGGGPWH